MQDHIRDLLTRFQYSEQLKETAIFRILFGCGAPSQVIEDLDIHNSYTLRNWVNLYQQKIQTGLITLPAMSETQKQDVLALNQRNEELEKALQQVNLLILSFNTMIEVAEKDGAARAVKTTNPKKIWNQTVLKIRESEIAKVSVGSLC